MHHSKRLCLFRPYIGADTLPQYRRHIALGTGTELRAQANRNDGRVRWQLNHDRHSRVIIAGFQAQSTANSKARQP